MRIRADQLPPKRLTTFDPDDWPGGPQQAFDSWVEARKVHAAEHGWVRDRIVEAAQTPDEPWNPGAS